LKIFSENIEIFVASDSYIFTFSHYWFDWIKSGINIGNFMIILCTLNSVRRLGIIFGAWATLILDKDIRPIYFEDKMLKVYKCNNKYLN